MPGIHQSAVGASLIICERILVEHDSVVSAIRMVDLFFVPPWPADTGGGVPFISMAVLFSARFLTPDDQEHNLSIKIQRPDGEITDVGKPNPFVLNPPKAQGASAGINFGIPTLNVIVKQLGTHFLIAYLNGHEIARTLFTLIQIPEQSSE